ncbi:MAG TPA: lantibiotic immunity ABC transporter MutG family permease subunit [Ruminococcaceae bacterium]|jgi:ABC-2 type transport system permease protein|nr:lantibiotic immunity ABC transporter MutG family permease subunit [Oscillospiraceae bacterium]
MGDFVRYLHSDFLKIKRRSILLIHILVPIVGIAFFIILDIFHQTPGSGSTAGGVLGGVAVAFPTLIGVACSMAAEQESEAGNFQFLLTFRSKLIPFFSMAAMLLILGLGSALLTSFGFEALFAAVRHQTPYGPDYYFWGTLLVYASNIFIYIFHLFLSLRFNKAVSIGIGIVESMLSGLLITGLGDGIWVLIPCAWGLRFLKIFEYGGTEPIGYGLNAGIVCCCIGTVLMCLFSCIWFSRWEGKKAEE